MSDKETQEKKCKHKNITGTISQKVCTDCGEKCMCLIACSPACRFAPQSTLTVEEAKKIVPGEVLKLSTLSEEKPHVHDENCEWVCSLAQPTTKRENKLGGNIVGNGRTGYTQAMEDSRIYWEEEIEAVAEELFQWELMPLPNSLENVTGVMISIENKRREKVCMAKREIFRKYITQVRNDSLSSLLSKLREKIDKQRREIIKTPLFKTPNQDSKDEEFNKGLDTVLNLLSELEVKE